MSAFVHLHNHSEYSLLDGFCTVEELTQAAQAAGSPAIALTDHGVVHGLVSFYRAARSAGVKPILGCELYVTEQSRFEKRNNSRNDLYHLVFLAENEIGYHNLLQLSSRGHTEGFYHKPRVDAELLERYSEGLTVLSGCLSGEIPQLILRDDLSGARQLAQHYAELYGREHFYLELQDHGLDEERQVNAELLRLSKDLSIPCVASQDTHYLRQQDALPHDYVLCVQTGARLNDRNRMRFPNDQFYLRSPEEMNRLFAECPSAVENTLRIAESCDFRFAFDRFHLPEYPLTAGIDAETYLRSLVRDGLIKRYGKLLPAAVSRVEEELAVISQMGFVGYFLIVWDFVRFAHEQGIPVGPGRGSVTGSLVAYALEITQVDPLSYDLIFERFLNPARVTLPDIDIDFCFERRGEVISYVIGKYGKDRVAQIATFGTLGARSAIRDLGRVMEFSVNEIDHIASLIPFEHEQSVDRALQQSKELQKELSQKPRVAELFNLARRIEGKPRNVSMHAAGVVITPEPLTNLLPLLRPREEGLLTQYAMNDLELLGFLKIDFLGLRTLTLLEHACRMIREQEGVSLELGSIPLDDSMTYEMLCAGETDGVFQLESDGMRRVLRQLQPSCIEDIIATNALYRPGPMEHIPSFIAAKHGREAITYLHPRLEPILAGTYGVVVYQEQVMRIAHEVAGLSLGEADLLRRAMSKRDPVQVQALQEQFVNGAKTQGISGETAMAIFELIRPFGSYGFNKSHSAAYGILAYQTAWFKVHYPLYYFAALLTSFQGYQDQIIRYIQHLKSRNYCFLPPDINLSRQQFTVQQGCIRFGLLAIKNLGLSTIESILKERDEGGPYRHLRDFVGRLGAEVNKRHLVALISSGAFDLLGDRALNLMMLPELQDQVGATALRMRQGQTSLLSRNDEARLEAVESGVQQSEGRFTLRELQNMEMETTGFTFSREVVAAPRAAAVGGGKIMASDDEEKATQRLVLRISQGSGVKLSTLKELLQHFPGRVPVYLELQELSRVQLIPEEYWVSLQAELLSALTGLLGTINVVVKK
ncbi:MAG: DNA polymerase III subunit alpha [Symbiobacteriaceae bacterium]|nr:DNA polymerase III subunit alpha [Symbiobacteriaceae bacterium]